MRKSLYVALCAAAALAPLGSAQASGGVIVSVSTPEFGFRFGAPVYAPPIYAPIPVVVNAPVYATPLLVRPLVVVPPPRPLYRRPVIVTPRVIYAPASGPRPRRAHPHGAAPDYEPAYGQQAAYRMPWGPR